MTCDEMLRNRIEKLCDERKLSVNKLAVMSGINQSTLDHIMTGDTRNPGVFTLMRVAHGLSMTLTELLTVEGIDDAMRTNPKKQSSEYRTNRLSQRKRQVAKTEKGEGLRK